MYELPEPEIYTDERRAQFLFSAVATKEEWDETAAEVRSWGLDPVKIPYVDPDLRDKLPTRAEWDAEVRDARVAWNRRSA